MVIKVRLIGLLNSLGYIVSTQHFKSKNEKYVKFNTTFLDGKVQFIIDNINATGQSHFVNLGYFWAMASQDRNQ